MRADTYPVSFDLERPKTMSRGHVFLRIALLVLLSWLDTTHARHSRQTQDEREEVQEASLGAVLVTGLAARSRRSAAAGSVLSRWGRVERGE